jgi:hypothetical protein
MIRLAESHRTAMTSGPTFAVSLTAAGASLSVPEVRFVPSHGRTQQMES